MIKCCEICNLTLIDNAKAKEIVAVGDKAIPTDATPNSVKSYFDSDTCPVCNGKLREMSKLTSSWWY
jgi:hypothetical protein